MPAGRSQKKGVFFMILHKSYTFKWFCLAKNIVDDKIKKISMVFVVVTSFIFLKYSHKSQKLHS